MIVHFCRGWDSTLLCRHYSRGPESSRSFAKIASGNSVVCFWDTLIKVQNWNWLSISEFLEPSSFLQFNPGKICDAVSNNSSWSMENHNRRRKKKAWTFWPKEMLGRKRSQINMPTLARCSRLWLVIHPLISIFSTRCPRIKAFLFPPLSWLCSFLPKCDSWKPIQIRMHRWPWEA